MSTAALPTDLAALYQSVLRSSKRVYILGIMNIKETAKTAMVLESTVRDWMEQGLGHVKCEGDALIARVDLMMWLMRNKASIATARGTLDEMRRRSVAQEKKNEKYRGIRELSTAFAKTFEPVNSMNLSQAAAASNVSECTIKKWLRQGLGESETGTIWIEPYKLSLWLACRKFLARQQRARRKSLEKNNPNAFSVLLHN